MKFLHPKTDESLSYAWAALKGRPLPKWLDPKKRIPEANLRMVLGPAVGKRVLCLWRVRMGLRTATGARVSGLIVQEATRSVLFGRN